MGNKFYTANSNFIPQPLLTRASIGTDSLTASELANDITPIDSVNANSNQNWQGYQPMVYEISTWALVDEATLSSKVVSQFECLLSIDGTGYEQRQSLALQRGK